MNVDEISEYIVVVARILTENKQAMGKIQVNINDNINNLKDVYPV
jgi:hypothetical protein